MGISHLTLLEVESFPHTHIAANTMATKNCTGIKEFPSDVVNLCKLPPKCEVRVKEEFK